MNNFEQNYYPKFNLCREYCNKFVNSFCKDCKYTTIHALQIPLIFKNPAIEERPRQSGKTTELINIAYDAVLTNNKVLFVCLNCEYLYLINSKIKYLRHHFKHLLHTINYRSIDKMLRGNKYDVVLIDEIFPNEYENTIKEKLENMNPKIIKGYFTSYENSFV